MTSELELNTGKDKVRFTCQMDVAPRKGFEFLECFLWEDAWRISNLSSISWISSFILFLKS